MTIKAFLFDLNGTMIDDMEYHAIAWEDILNKDLNAGLSYEQVQKEMYGKNSELLERVFGKNHFTQAYMDKISMEKERRYQAAFKSKLQLINGLALFLEQAAKEGVKMAIGSAAIPFNIDFVLDNLGIRDYFGAIVSAEDVAVSKPDPETFLKCAQLLGVLPHECLVFEDAPKGVEAAANAGMPCMVITTMHEKEAFASLTNITGFISDYTAITPRQVISKILVR